MGPFPKIKNHLPVRWNTALHHKSAELVGDLVLDKIGQYLPCKRSVRLHRVAERGRET